MISITKKILLVELILLCPPHAPIKAIDEDVARNIAITGGILAGGASALGVHLLSNCLTNKNIASKLASPIIGIALGGLTEYSLHQWLYTKTPSGRITCAKDLIQKALDVMQKAEKNLVAHTHDEIITKNFISDERFIAYLTQRFATNWPLVLARDFLITLSKKLKMPLDVIRQILNNAHVCLELAIKEMQKNTNKYVDLLQESNHLQEEINDIKAHCTQYDKNITLIKQAIENLITTIALYPQFTSQVALHESHIQHQEMLKQLAQQHRQLIEIEERKLAQQQLQFAQQQEIERRKLSQQERQFTQQQEIERRKLAQQ